MVFGVALILAALVYAYGYFVNVVVGLAEPVYVSPVIEALVVAEGLVALFGLAVGFASLMCRTRRGLWVLGVLLAVTAADIGLSFFLYPKAERSACLHSLREMRRDLDWANRVDPAPARAGPAPADPIDDSCLKQG